MKKILFVCSQNKLRSPTAEQIFKNYPGVEVSSAGLDHDAIIRLSSELIEWADIIFVMEWSHQNKIRKKFKDQIKKKIVICLKIPDEFDFMSPELVELLKKRVSPFLPAGSSQDGLENRLF